LKWLLGNNDRYELPNSDGTVATRTDRLDVRTGHTRVTLAQAVAQFQRKSFRDEYATGDPHFGRELFQNYFASISRGFETVNPWSVANQRPIWDPEQIVVSDFVRAGEIWVSLL
jgi:hypothetical protein